MVSQKKIAALIVGAFLIGGAPTAHANGSVSRVIDGDTITLSNGERIRLIQIDSPEMGTKECFGFEAKMHLTKILSQSDKLSFSSDPKLDQVDRYGRSLRYVFVGSTNVNLKMVEIGAAAPYFYRGEKGVYASQLIKAAQSAQKRKMGLWKSCPSTRLEPDRAITTK
jgi:endonuclease YncB( thermonuclease family)